MAGRGVRLAVSLALGAAACVGDGATTASPVAPPDPSFPPSSVATPRTTVPAGSVTAIQVSGWTLVITEPSPGAATSTTPTICYEITGTDREAVVALDLRLSASGATEPTASALVDASVGRGSVVAPFEAVSPGTFDLEVGLVLNGDVWGDRVVRIPGIRLEADLPPAGCEATS